MSPESTQCLLNKGVSVADICEVENKRVGDLIQRAYKAGRRDMRELIYPEDTDRRAAWFGDIND